MITNNNLFFFLSIFFILSRLKLEYKLKHGYCEKHVPEGYFRRLNRKPLQVLKGVWTQILFKGKYIESRKSLIDYLSKFRFS
jgi:hypothetical protein